MTKLKIGIAVVIASGIGAIAWLTMVNPMPIIRTTAEKQIIAFQDAQTIPAGRFEILFCGTGSPQHHEDRGQPCVGVIAGGKFFLFDAGQGAAQRLNQFVAPLQKLDTVFLTHLHSDHMSGLGETLHNGWLYGRQHIVEVVGPPGTAKSLDGFQTAYEDDLAERQRVLGVEYLDATTGMGKAREIRVSGDEALTVYDKEGVLVKAFHVIHPDWSDAYGYRIEFRGKSVVISGDTAYTPMMGIHAKDTDILIHEAVNMDLMSVGAEILEDAGSPISPDRLALIASVHTPTEDVAKAATEANARKLVVNHLIPPVPANFIAERLFTLGMDDHYEGEIIVARDGMRMVLLED